MDRMSNRRKLIGSTVGEIVTCDRSNDSMAQAKFRNGLGDSVCFVRVDCQRRIMGDITETAIAGALVAQNHEGGGALFPAFALVWTGGAATDRVKALLTMYAVDTGIVRPCGKADFEPVRFARGVISHMKTLLCPSRPCWWARASR